MFASPIRKIPHTEWSQSKILSANTAGVYLFIAPSLLTFAVFTFIPVVWSFIISFQKYNVARGGTWMNPLWANYTTAFTMLNGIFIDSIRNTVVYTIFTVSANILIGLILASLIQPLSNRPAHLFSRGILFARRHQCAHHRS